MTDKRAHNFIDLTGQKFDRLTVIEYAGKGERNEILWLCECSCPNKTKKVICSQQLRYNRTKSCGCLQKEIASKRMSKHKKYGTPEYRSWFAMKSRCDNPNNIGYKDYGGRGITYCEKWKTFEGFIEDMEMQPLDGQKYSLDRKDTNGNYCKENCKWSTIKEQANNTRKNKIIEYQGKKYTLAQLAESQNINSKTLNSRINTGMSVEEAINFRKIPDEE